MTSPWTARSGDTRVPRFDINDLDIYDEDFATADELAFENKIRSRERREDRPAPSTTAAPRFKQPRSLTEQAFKCGHCKQFIGAPVSGGRQRNHCPNCLYSRHVDGKMPGDRKANCGALMQPVGLLERRNGEHVLIHRCLGCGKYDPNRMAADDNVALVEDIPVVTTIEELQARIKAT